MRKFAIVTDSSSGYKTGDFHDLYVVSLTVTCTMKLEDGSTKVITEYDDKLDQKQLFNWLNDKRCKVSTSQAPLGDLVKILDPIVDKYKDIYVFPIASSVSGSENSWNIIANDYPNVHIIHQYMGGPMLKMLIQDIYELSEKQELTLDTIKNYVENAKNKIFGYMIVEDLRAIANSGRIGKITSKILGSLKAKIIVSLNKEGMKFATVAFMSQKITKYIFNHLDKIMDELNSHDIKTLMFIRNDYDEKDQKVESFVNAAKQKFIKENVRVMNEEMPCVLTSHGGKNAVILMLQLK